MPSIKSSKQETRAIPFTRGETAGSDTFHSESLMNMTTIRPWKAKSLTKLTTT